ncbi:MAG: ABC transporter ATP-binding protein, partial [Bacilli bacterium]
MNAIEINNLKKSFKEFKLDILKFNVKEGYITGFIGPNGSGKTTTIKLIMNMLFKDEGSIKILGTEVSNDNISIKEKIGYVGETSGYLGESKLKNIKKMVCRFYKDWDDSLYNKYIRKFKLDENKIYKELSSGEKRQFDLIIALSHHPKLIIMDEPTANLDPLVRNEFLEILQEHMENEDVTVFYSTHITSDLDKASDYIALIFEGKIILYGEKDTLIEEHSIVRGEKKLLTEETQKCLISYKINLCGFEGLTKNKKEAYEIFGEEVIYDKVNLEDILMYYT